MTPNSTELAGDRPRIGPVLPDGRAGALELVFSRLPATDAGAQIETFTVALAAGGVSPEGLLGAYREGRLAGATLAQIQPGKTALVWPPRLVSGEPPSTAVELLEALGQWLARQQVCMAQALLPTDGDPDARTLRQGGFEYLTDLLYLVSPEDRLPVLMPQSPLAFETYDEASPRRLARIVDDTYRQTRDCPRLNGVRRIEDVLAGYRSVGVFDPSRWLIVRHGDEDVGCLLLADHPEHDNWELVYMGIMAAVRGHGWGTDVTGYAQWLTRRAGRKRLVLAVDAANDPAINAYAAAGFQAWDRRSVYVRVFATAE